MKSRGFMKTKKIIALIMTAVLSGSVLGGCQEPPDPLDRVHQVDKDSEEITIRELFEGSKEQLKYANYFSMDCECSGEYVTKDAKSQ